MLFRTQTNTCIFTGRIGNNLFQLSNLIAHSLKNQSKWVIPDHSHYWEGTNRIKYKVPFDIFDFKFPFRTKNQKFYRYNPNVFNFKKHPFYLDFLNVKFNGHYLSYKYFDDIRELLITKYLKPSVSLQVFLDNFKVDEHSAAISVRRGDFLDLQNLHTVLDYDYYMNALSVIEQRLGPLKKIYVFSDDLGWCKTKFSERKYVFIDGSIGEQFFLMTKMNNIVLSNSSFAWWGAYLNENCQNIIYPGRWFGPDNQHKFSFDLFPATWTVQY